MLLVIQLRAFAIAVAGVQRLQKMLARPGHAGMLYSTAQHSITNQSVWAQVDLASLSCCYCAEQ